MSIIARLRGQSAAPIIVETPASQDITRRRAETMRNINAEVAKVKNAAAKAEFLKTTAKVRAPKAPPVPPRGIPLSLTLSEAREMAPGTWVAPGQTPKHVEAIY